MTDTTTTTTKCAMQYTVHYNSKQYANLSFSLTITFASSPSAVPMIEAGPLEIDMASFVLRIDPSILQSSGL